MTIQLDLFGPWKVRAINYYGAKANAAHRYPAPNYPMIVEPFAGGAGYSLAHRDSRVLLFDLSQDVIGAWRYLIETPGSEILRLPVLAVGQSIPAELPVGARLLIGFNTMISSSHAQSRLVKKAATRPRWFWGASRRRSLAALADEIKHWQAHVGSYCDLPQYECTWFIDPPYQGNAGRHYKHGSQAIDYAHLGEWCRDRRGQAIVCEGGSASWLPFQPLFEAKGFTHKAGGDRRLSTEVIWTGPSAGSGSTLVDAMAEGRRATGWDSSPRFGTASAANLACPEMPAASSEAT